MQHFRPLSKRLPLLHPARLPRISKELANPQLHHPRTFATSASRHLLSRVTRPSLPYLSGPRGRHTRNRIFAFRGVSNDQKSWLRYEFRLFVYWTVMLWTVIGGANFAYWFMKQEWLDRLYPAPDDWSWFPKRAWRKAKLEHDEEIYGKSMVDWGILAWGYRRVFTWCEMQSALSWYADELPQNADWESSQFDFPGIDREAMRVQPVSDFDVKRVGYDVTSKSEQWKRAYFEALMGMTEVAEMCEDHVRDKKRFFLFPRDQVIGPSNPYPNPIFPGSPDAPLEEDCEPAYDSPSMYYCRILTTKGFSSRQRMDAGLAYASYLTYKGEHETASNLLSWCLDIAGNGFSISHPDIPLDSVINRNTSMIRPGAPLVTPNILTATTAIAQHHARSGDIPRALNIYLSVLRARRDAPVAPRSERYKDVGPDLSLRSVGSAINFIGSLLSTPTMGPPPPSGNEQFTRTKTNVCDESAIMAYVGELLFASAESGSKAAASRRRDALSWTRDAVEVAEAGHKDKALDGKSKHVCTQCVGTGLENWTKMLSVLANEKEQRQTTRVKIDLPPGYWPGKAKEEEELRWREEQKTSWSSWIPFWNRGSKRDPLLDDTDCRRELERVDTRRAMFAEERMMETLNRQIQTTSKWFVV